MSAPTAETERLSRYRHSAVRLSVSTTQQRVGPLDPGKYELYADGDTRFRQGGASVGFAVTPATPTVTPQGVTGATAYSYEAVEVDSEGAEASPAAPTSGKVSAASAAGSTATGNAALSGSNFNRVTGACSDGAVRVAIYRTAGGATQGRIGYATPSAGTYQFDDTGLVASGAAPTATTSIGRIAPERSIRTFIVDGVSGSDDDYLTLMTETGTSEIEYGRVT